MSQSDTVVLTRAGHTETTIEAPVSSAGKIVDMTITLISNKTHLHFSIRNGRKDAPFALINLQTG